MLRRLSLRDVAIVRALDIELAAGFTVLTGETGAGKSILIDALQLALGARAETSLVREGATRAEVSAEFDVPETLRSWLLEAGFDAGFDAGIEGEPDLAGDTLLLRRTVDATGKSRAWVNGSVATLAQLRSVADHLVDIHGQHAWQSLTRPAAVRALLDLQAGVDSVAMVSAWAAWRQAEKQLVYARSQRDTLAQERERLSWQISEVDKLAPRAQEWEQLNAEHQRLGHAQALLDAARVALSALSDDDAAAEVLCSRAVDALDNVKRYDNELSDVVDVLRGAQAQLQDAAHTLHGYLGRSEPDPERLAAMDSRIAAWVQLARRYKRTPAELPELLQGWKDALHSLDLSNDLEALERTVSAAADVWQQEARAVSKARHLCAPKLSAEVTQAMQQLGMAGGAFEVALLPLAEPEAGGLEAVELRVAGHAGSTPRALAKVASGGELSRLALAIAVTTHRGDGTKGTKSTKSTKGAKAAQDAADFNTRVPTLIFDEIDAGVGGAVADSVGRLMKQLGASAQVMAVTHLAQVAACADHHFVVSKALLDGHTLSDVSTVQGEARVSEIARMLGGERLEGTSRAHAAALLGQAPEPPTSARKGAKQR